MDLIADVIADHRPMAHTLVEGEPREDCSFCTTSWPCGPVLLAEACKSMVAEVDQYRAALKEWRGDCTGDAELEGTVWCHDSEFGWCEGHGSPPRKPLLAGWLVKVGLIPRGVKA